LSSEERSDVRSILNSELYENQAPREVYADLLDGGVYVCSWRTMYRILRQYAEVRERRNQLRHPAYARPELLATAPKQLWSWDITKLRGPVKGSHYYLYVIIDVFSRYVVGWMIAESELASLAQELIAESCASQGIQPDQLTIHADNGSPMQAHSVAQLMADLGVNKSHSRPHVSNDNPFSEAQFKTLKYNAAFPGEFGSLADARQWADAFFTWYNHEHHHTGIGLFTPADVHTGQTVALNQQRQAVMQLAYAAHPDRFVKGAPVLPPLPTAVWINPPPQVGSPILPVSLDAGHGTLLAPVREGKAPLESDLSAQSGNGVTGCNSDEVLLVLLHSTVTLFHKAVNS
jgi:putative transposase